MNMLNAVKAVLTEAGEPLHVTEITRRMLEHKLWTAAGKTPVDSVRSALAMHINHHGCQSVFERTRPATFALRAWSTLQEASPLTPAAPASVATDRSAKARNGTAGEGEGTLSFTDAAEQVLTRFGKSLAMHYRDITAKALELGLVATQGKTPEATRRPEMLACLGAGGPPVMLRIPPVARR